MTWLLVRKYGCTPGGAVVAYRLPFHEGELAGSLPDGLVERDAFVLAIHDAFYVGAAICVLGVLVGLASSRRPPKS